MMISEKRLSATDHANVETGTRVPMYHKSRREPGRKVEMREPAESVGKQQGADGCKTHSQRQPLFVAKNWFFSGTFADFITVPHEAIAIALGLKNLCSRQVRSTGGKGRGQEAGVR